MKLVFHDRADINQFSLKRGLPPFALREIMSLNPLSVGIPKEYHDKIFKVFESLGDHKDSTGIGLSIVKNSLL